VNRSRRMEREERQMSAEWQEIPSPAVGEASDGRAPAPPPPLVPTLDHVGSVVLEAGEVLIGSFPASGVRLRARVGNVDQGWGPLEVRVTLTTHRIVMTASPGTPSDAPWSTPSAAPVSLRAIEPPQALRGVAPIRIAGHVRWINVTRVDADSSRAYVTVPAPLGGDATLTMHLPGQLGHRFLAIARAAFVAAKRPLAVDTPNRVEAPLTMS
jgi:hypothetical protein